MLNTHGYVSLGPCLCITVVVPANNDFRRKLIKKLPEIVATMNHCRSAPLRRSQQSTTLTRHRKWPIENRSCAGLWTITNFKKTLLLFTCSSSCIDAARGNASATRAIIVISTILSETWSHQMYICQNVCCGENESCLRWRGFIVLVNIALEGRGKFAPL